jgi:hypothetical protein
MTTICSLRVPARAHRAIRRYRGATGALPGLIIVLTVTDLRFQVLGPVRAWLGGREVALGPRKQREVLAVLLLNLDRPISADDLVTAVWWGKAPPAAAAAVHTYVRGLRDALEPERTAWSRGGVVSSGPHGYLLRVEPDRVDSRRFLRLVGDARRAWAAGDARASLDACVAALTAWTGPPLAGLKGHIAHHPRVGSLHDERVSAEVLGADAALACGRFSQWVPVLAAHDRLRRALSPVGH